MRVLLADDSDPLRRAIARILSWDPDVEVCGEARDGAEALTKAQELLPDLVLLDISMPGPNGLETARLLRQALPRTRILVISQHERALVLPAVIAAGADDLLEKGRLASDLIPAIDRLRNTS
ncbi:MAG: response regulator [Terriglobia bacterium]